MARSINIRHTPAPPKRIDVVDVARGAAIAAMVVYHLVWDLGFFGLIDADVAASEPMRWASRAIASAFLFIAGVSAALAHRGRFSPRAFRSQFVKIALGAAAVTIVTSYALPQAPVTFGILHALAVGTLLAAPFARMHWEPALIAGAAVVALPMVWRSPALDDPLWQWLGLGAALPSTVDWRPVFPWVGVMLLGVAAARTLTGQAFLIRSATWRAEGGAARLLALAGRWSLWIYLAHQPVLVAIVYVIATLAGAPAPGLAGGGDFVPACVEQCKAAGAEAARCETSCRCVADRIGADPSWRVAARTEEGRRAALTAASEACGVAR
ncbi:MAG: DUF1624 domain-containing protein [Rhizobiales bacterium]|nr:DUF1624 domain-containing protein [Hyphomicrobiales bacterium]